MAYVITFMLLVGVVLVVTSPLRRGPLSGEDDAGLDASESAEASGQRIDLEAARDAKYREIRDAELDHDTGKLSNADFEAIDSTLRAEAIDLLRKLDALDGSAPAEGAAEAQAAEETAN
jgi:hypothetical protein